MYLLLISLHLFHSSHLFCFNAWVDSFKLVSLFGLIDAAHYSQNEEDAVMEAVRLNNNILFAY